tara:strand:- start:121 stop:273 length:153 start_codon:yes stop_codon:yes gene_type:complete
LKFPRFISEKLIQNIVAPYVVKKLPVGKRGIKKIITKRNDVKFRIFGVFK